MRLTPRRPSHTTVVAYLSLFLVLSGGAALAAGQLGKNSVGSKQLKKNAVTTAKIKKEAVTGAKVKKGTLTGAQINASSLGTVPSAQTAQSAETAQTAQSIAAPEPWHEVTEFLNGWKNVTLSVNFPETVAFFKDQEGIVHLRGTAISGESNTAIFRLPSGFRPASGRFIQEPVSCTGAGCPAEAGRVRIIGSDQKIVGEEGLVIAPPGASSVFLDGVTFRAES